MTELSPQTRNQLNFSGGPGALPESVLEQLKEAMIAVPEVGLSILGISHRSDWFAAVVKELEGNIRELMGLPSDYHVLFLQGGATQQFTMLPMSLLRRDGPPAEYLQTGYWSAKAIPEARKIGPVRVVWNGENAGYHRLPTPEELQLSPDAPYFHYVSNETVEGLQFKQVMGRDDVPRICDMSSDFLSAPGDYTQFAMIYAHAQKNIGPAGVTVVILKDDLVRNAPDNLPGFLDYREQIKAHSILNTPPVFAIYAVLLVTRWLKNDIGGLANMAKINAEKARLIYQAIDASQGFYHGHATPENRSLMNIAFTLPSPEHEQAFLQASAKIGFSGLHGHRSLGGIRASLYNGLSIAAAERLVCFMRQFPERQSAA